LIFVPVMYGLLHKPTRAPADALVGEPVSAH
jgi:hypothetical protein